MSEFFQGLGRNGSPLVVGADMAALEIPGAALSNGRKRIQGWASGTPSDSEGHLRFAALTGVRAMIEKFPSEKAGEAYAPLLSGQAQFRVVLTMKAGKFYCNLNCTVTIRCMCMAWPFNAAG